jgi:hypothetical protein
MITSQKTVNLNTESHGSRNRVMDVATSYGLHIGRAVAQAVSSRLSTAEGRLRARSGNVRFVVDKAARGEVFSEYFCFSCQ